MAEKTGRRLILNNRKRYEDGEAGLSGDTLCIWLKGVTLQDAIPVFTNRLATKKITFEYGEMKDVYKGFTEVRGLLDEGDRVTIILGEEAATNG